jgi:hypothetical protein
VARLRLPYQKRNPCGIWGRVEITAHLLRQFNFWFYLMFKIYHVVIRCGLPYQKRNPCGTWGRVKSTAIYCAFFKTWFCLILKSATWSGADCPTRNGIPVVHGAESRAPPSIAPSCHLLLPLVQVGADAAIFQQVLQNIANWKWHKIFRKLLLILNYVVTGNQ